MPSDIHPPIFDNDTNFDTYCREVEIWLLGTQCPQEKQAARLALKMKGRAKDIALGIPTEQLKAEGGVNHLLAELGKVFSRDKTVSLFAAIESFETFHRDRNQNISEYISEFSTRLGELRQQAGVLRSDQLYGPQVLAYRLLEQASLSDEQKRLLRATCVEISFEAMVTQMKRAFGETIPSENTPAPSASPESSSDNTETLTLIVCFKCRKAGHVASQCYSRQGNRGKRGGVNHGQRGRSGPGRRGQGGQGGDATGVFKMSIETVETLTQQVGLRGPVSCDDD